MNQYRFKGASTGLAGQSFNVTGTFYLGSDDACDIVIREPEIAARHVCIRIGAGGAAAECLAGSGLWINGEMVNQAALKSGDEVRLGAARLVFQAPGLRPASILREEPARKASKLWWVLATGVLAAATAGAWWYYAGSGWL